MGTAEDFWSDDAAALQQREAERATGLRMPAASLPMDLRGSHASASADYRTSTRKRGIFPLVVTAATVLIGIAGVVIYARSPVVTLAEFSELRQGMDVVECNAVVGATGVTVEEAVLPPTPFMFQRFESIEWVNSDKSKAVAGFIDGKLSGKAQERLR